ncbi:MAG TPA: beta-ketoacyl-[acyl-carrier-protein] synthase family protein [Chryseosolibacter sp.]
MKGKVYVAGAGAICAIGNSLPETLRAFQNKTSGIGHITSLDTVHKGVLPVGEVKLSNKDLALITKHKSVTRTALLGIHAAQEALNSSGLKDISRYRTGLISATTVGGMDLTENFFVDFSKDNSKGDLNDVVNHECGRSTELIADALNIRHYVSTINTACSSSVNSIIFGTKLIQHGMLDVVVAGGTDALTKFTLNGFNSLMILDKEPCRPFDATRNGLNLGEGAGFVVLVSQKVLEEQKLNASVIVSGFANTNDAFHQTASSPEGRGSFNAMKLALEVANLQPADIDYINLHGTGTVNNDQSEGTAVKRMFGDTLPKLSSTKSFTGHTLGACGGLEAAFSVMAIEKQCVFPNLRFTQAMPDIGIVPQTEFQSTKVNNVMSNSFGFGGNCSSIIFSKA